MNRLSKLHVAALLFFFLAVAQTGWTHHRLDPLTSAPSGPAHGASVERAIGTMHRVLIDDRVARVGRPFYWLEADDGTSIALKDVPDRGFVSGDRVEVTGRRNGRTLFATDVRQRPEARRPTTPPGGSSVSLTGKLALLHADYFDDAHSEFVFEVHDASGATPLKLPVLPPELQREMQVIVSGTLTAARDGVVPETISILALPPAAFEKATAKALSSSVLVILMTFTDSPAIPFTHAEVQSVFAGGAGSGSVTEYFREVSFGQQVLSPTITNWLSTGAATPSGCNWQQMGTLGRNAANATGYNTSSYSYIVYVFPRVSACGWAGLAYIGRSGSWINGRNTTSLYGHELGHNFGLLHAGSLRCSVGVIGGSCSVSEYGDPFGIMGNISAMHFDASQKLDLGWIGSGTVVTHNAGTVTYVLSPIETGGGGTYAVRIPAATNRTYWIEYRQPIGFDSGLSAYPNNGAQMRVASPFETLCSGCDGYSNDTQLLDATPGTATFTDAALTVGNTFTDTTYGINVRVLSATAGALTVEVAKGGSGGGTPSITSPAPNTTLPGASATFNWSANGAGVTEWWLYVGSSAGANNYYDSGNLGGSLSTTASGLPADGRTLFVRLWFRIGGVWQSSDYPYTAASAAATPGITSPAPGSVLPVASVTFNWTANGTAVTEWWLQVGSSMGASNYHNSGSLGTLSRTVAGLPTNGAPVWVRLWFKVNGVWQSSDHQYTAATAASGPAITSPAAGSVLPGATTTFNWTANATAVTEWWLYVGSTVGGTNYHDSGSLGTSQSRTVNGLPTNGTPVWVRLWFKVNGTWQSSDFQYTAAGASSTPTMTSPPSGSVLPGATTTFNWVANGAAVAEWWLYVGSAVGANNYHDSGSLGTALSRTVNGLPTNDTPVFVRLWYKVGGSWQSVDFQYTAS
ncbi:MAG TPA: hypothetical protein VNE58_01745 [Casimicrobiaceae bacterium]|nr:hypothetical protein [Casimicrobiaceae bacterium]